MPFPPAPPEGTPLVDEKGSLTRASRNWFTEIWNHVRAPARTVPPVTSSDRGVEGQLSFDTNFLYVNIGGQWKRVPLNSF